MLRIKYRLIGDWNIVYAVFDDLGRGRFLEMQKAMSEKGWNMCDAEHFGILEVSDEDEYIKFKEDWQKAMRLTAKRRKNGN